MKAPVLVPCTLCTEEWGPADLNPAGLCPGCVEDLAARSPDTGEPEGLHYGALLDRTLARQQEQLAAIRERGVERRAREAMIREATRTLWRRKDAA